jgi:hypothetical protein
MAHVGSTVPPSRVVRTRALDRLQFVWPGALGLAPVTGLAAAQGGYFPTSWGWATIALVWLSATTIALSRAAPGPAQVSFVAAWAALALWTGLSALWTIDVPQTMLEFERILLYAAAVVAVAQLPGARAGRHLLAGLVCGIGAISLFSLATRLFPDLLRLSDATGTQRLSEPLGYWNGLSIFAAMGMILAAGFAAHSRRLRSRAAAAALLVPLLATFYFTFGRTGWVALAGGLATALATDRRRLGLLGLLALLAPVLATIVWLAADSYALTHVGAPHAEAAAEGHRLALYVAALALLAAAAAALYGFAQQRVRVPRRAGTAVWAVVAGACVAAVAVTLVQYGGPTALAHKTFDAFKADQTDRTDLNSRLVDISGNGRYRLWKIAWGDAKSHPWLGSGAGSYERYFLQHQTPQVSRVRDAHGLYIETLAELGPVGVLLLGVALLLPLAVAFRRGPTPLEAAAAGAYVAFLIHAAADWDWELSAVTIVPLLIGGTLVAPRRHDSLRSLGPWSRALALAAILALCVFASVCLVGNSALSASESAREAQQLNSAAAQARRARAWLPWSPAPWEALGRVQRDAGFAGAARSSFRKAVSIDSGDWELWVELAAVSHGRAREWALYRAGTLYPMSGLLPTTSGNAEGRPAAP